MQNIDIAALYAAANLIIIALLALRVVQGRLSKRISLGTNGDEDMERRVRAHGNAIEYVPGLLICLVILAIMGAPVWALHVIGVLCTGGRILHGIGFSTGFMLGRQLGTILTWTGYYVGAGLLIWQALS